MEHLQKLPSWLRPMTWNDRSLERDDLLAEEAEQKENRLIQELRADYQSLKRTFVIVVLLLSCIIAVVAFPWHSDFHGAQSTGPVPEIPFSKVTFRQDERFSGAWSEESIDAWSELMPPGDGFVVIENPRNYHLPPGKSSRYGEVYDISMWHQLHCLLHMRTYMSSMHSFANQSNMQQLYEVVLAPQADHILHCFDYLRQAVMCAGDMTLEQPRTESDGRRFAVDGWDIEHEHCRSWDAMADFVEKHAVGHHHRSESS
ncbi:hypothetical protein CERZMDRAFT_100510 [Cercospora zeae-maydis SCOH1-5]|uniref:Oxidase ustYa n=1 Tax=Cercospora zeae-maydis SCOH1-5 TaxID=717836 RepID=A0A6A6F8J9_9PEZI|nr:hypothetical protein CERZMDRAFT_100510 [Cercospora zeae-maydis SCOH1-5]